MKNNAMKIIILGFLIVALSACAAMMIPETNDPIEKLKWAETSLKTRRPIPAEKLLKEAIDIFSEQENFGMLGGAYNIYGRLDLMFPKGDDKDNTKAVINFEKSITLLEKFFSSGGPKKGDEFFNMYYQWATNSAFNLGQLYRKKENLELSCDYFNRSFSYYEAGLKLVPDADVISEGYNSFKEAIERNKELSKCDQM